MGSGLHQEGRVHGNRCGIGHLPQYVPTGEFIIPAPSPAWTCPPTVIKSTMCRMGHHHVRIRRMALPRHLPAWLHGGTPAWPFPPSPPHSLADHSVAVQVHHFHRTLQLRNPEHEES